jgi:hypothetical protein
MAVVMARKKALVPHFERGSEFIFENPVRYHPDLLNYRLKGHFVETVNNQIVPRLADGWQNAVKKSIDSSSTADLTRIELVAKQYVAERVARRVNPIEWRETIARIKRIESFSKKLLDELNDWREGYNPIWKRIEKISEIDGLAPLTHDDVYPIISRLYSASHEAVIQAQSELKQGNTLSHREPWKRFVTQLADLWKQAGGSATSPKSGRGSYAPPSPFARLVWAVMTNAVPKPLREYTASRGAMQAAISKVLRVSRQNTSGPFSKNNASNKSRHGRRKKD